MDLKTEIEAAIGTARRELAQRAPLELDVPDGLPPVRAAPGQLEQVFASLLAGAARAVPGSQAQGHAIRIAARTRGDRMEVEVRDGGAGILPADLPRILELLGATIEVEGTPGHGSTFRLGLPLQEKTPPAPAAAAPAPGRRGRSWWWTTSRWWPGAWRACSPPTRSRR